ncbi:MAG: branched-chain amino acid aminotransferase [Myxococcales bacterium]|nr:branched-chain amino acid aminotransferase [Myxococcales bacterium]
MKIIEVEATKRKPKPPADTQLGFGRYFSDHMMLMEFSPDKGWHDARIEPYHKLTFDPACMALHYAQQVFDGLKAYRGADGGIRLFRYRDHLERLHASAKRVCIPEFDVDKVADALKHLVLLDRHWVPKTEGCSLYIRPNIIATDPFLGVRPSENYLFYIILSPVGAYYPEGFNPVRIQVNDTMVRAVEGGIGEAKAGANYVASLLGQVQAKAAGFTQVLWLDASERRYVEEVGTMNIFFKIDGEVITAPLRGSILPGVTRRSTIQLLKDWDVPVSERRLAIDEIVDAARNERLEEVFGTGTAAVISPVGHFNYKGETFAVGDGLTGKLSQRLFDHLTALQYGKVEDPHGWVERIDL